MPQKLTKTPIIIPKDIAQLGTILSVWAHPDDETFSAGGIMAAAAANGQTVAIIHATKGEMGIQDESRWPADKLGEIRAEELAQAMNVLGLSKHHWLGYPDGSCRQVDKSKPVEQIKSYIEKYQPDTILTFGPEGMTGHEDHCTVSGWVGLAAKDFPETNVYQAVMLRDDYEAGLEISSKYNFFFNIDRPPLVEEDECEVLFKLPDDLLIKKYQALMSMPSQYESMFNNYDQKAICLMLCNEAFVKARS